MEEILASIRKIISEDGEQGATGGGEVVTQDFGPAGRVGEPMPAEPGPPEVQDAAQTTDEMAIDLPELDPLEDEWPVDTGPDEASIEDDWSEPAIAVAEPEPNSAQPDAANFRQSEHFEPQQSPPEADMAVSAKYQDTVLTEENTADAAASALGKLISKMEFGGENTIEGLVRELLKPMIKDWLDTNLPSIVESRVEAEVQRIARMAR